MDIEQVNDNILEDLAGQHRSYFVTPTLSERLGQACLTEVVLYAYGVHAGSDEAEESREGREIKPHEGRWDCEISEHFWRGVCEARGIEIGAPFNKSPRKKTGCKGARYAKFKLHGGPLLLSRLSDFFELYSRFPDVAGDLRDEIERDKGFVQLNGLQAQKAIYCLYDGAIIGGRLEAAEEALNLPRLSGRGIGFGEWDHRPTRPDLSKLKPIPPNWEG